MAAQDTHVPAPRRNDGLPPVIEPGHSFGSVTDKIASVIQTTKTPWGWVVGFAIGFTAS